MIILRPVTLDDLDVIYEMAAQAGLTSLPNDRALLKTKVQLSVDSFSKPVHKAGDELYLFLLEDISTGQKAGICGIKARTGVSTPVYFYLVEELPPLPSHLPTPKERRILRPIQFSHHPTEICSLFLRPEYRRDGLGRLLSLSRFLFIASHRKRFKNKIIADLRGVISPKNESLLWNALGRKYLDMDFNQALLYFEDNRVEYFKIVMPFVPIYVGLLPKEAQEVIGEVHPHTKPALNMLLKEGFKKGNFIDVFEGGPTIEADVKDIRSIKNSYVGTVSRIITETIESETYIICNDKLSFRSCYGTLQWIDEKHVTLYKQTAEALQLQEGDLIRFARSAPPPNMVYKSIV